MSKQTTRSTKKSLGLISDRDIELWNSDVKKRGANTRRSKIDYSKNISINNEQDFSIIFDSSMNELRQKTRSERSNSSTISNRMKYLEVDMKRKKQMAQIAKNKYQKMIQVRHKSFIQKKSLQKQRQNQSKKHLMSVTLQASRIKVERKNSAINTQIWRDNNQQTANTIKDRRFFNEKFIAEREQMQKQKKKRIVEKQQKMADVSRQKLRKLSNQKIIEGKNQHSKKMFQEYVKSQSQRLKNINLMEVFKHKVKAMGTDAVKYKQQLQEYEKLLGIGNRHRKNQSKNSFYMTN